MLSGDKKERYICKNSKMHNFKPASPLQYGSFRRGLYICQNCGKKIPVEELHYYQ